MGRVKREQLEAGKNARGEEKTDKAEKRRKRGRAQAKE